MNTILYENNKSNTKDQFNQLTSSKCYNLYLKLKEIISLS